MRHLSESFAIGALRWSVSIEQFLGPAFHHDRRGIRWVAVGPRGNDRYTVVLYLSWTSAVSTSAICWSCRRWLPTPTTARSSPRSMTPSKPSRSLSESRTPSRERWANLGVAAEDYSTTYCPVGCLIRLRRTLRTNIVRTLLTAEGGDERSINWWLEGLERRAGYLHISSDMIYWPAGRSWTADEIIEHVEACTPIAL